MDSNIGEPYPLLSVALFLFSSDFIFYALNSVAFLLLLSFSFLVSGSEVAFFSLSSDQIERCGESDLPAEKAIKRLLEKPKLLLATILILNNFINIAIVTLSTIVTWKVVGKNAEGLVMGILTFTVTFAILFFGEIIPKNFALNNSLSFAKKLVRPLFWAQRIFKPLSMSLMSLSNVIEKRVKRRDYHLSVDELNYALDITTTGKDTSIEEKELLKGIVNFGTLNVKQVMNPRLDIVAYPMDMSFKDLLKAINTSNFSRIPIYSESIDKIEGILYVKDLLPYLEGGDVYDWTKLIRPAYFIPENKKIDSLLKDFQTKRVHMAIVVDEYGGTSGLITLEDVLEEIVGEINDEFDLPEDIGYNKVDDNTYVFEAKTMLNDFCKVVNVNPSIFEEVKGESESIAGLLLELHLKLPSAGTQIRFEQFTFTVAVSDTKRIKKVRVFINREHGH